MAAISKDPVARFVERQEWISPAVTVPVQNAIQRPFRENGHFGQSLLSLLHGKWLHEPLHAVLTDIPVGAWTVTISADTIGALSGQRSINKVADVSLLIGMAGAAGAAITGAVDWSEIKQPAPRRVGAAHALLNVAATGLFALSAVARRKDCRRPLARSLAIAGYVALALSAHLGGNLVYEHGIGVGHAEV